MTELGNRLKEARISKGMSLDDLQAATKIQKRYLIGIEEGNYSMMPGKFYIRAFIKQYAEVVGLEPEEIFEEYKTDIPTTTVNDDIPKKLSRVQTKKNLTATNSKILDAFPKILISAFVLGALFLLWYLWPKNADSTGELAESGNKNVKFEESAKLSKENENQMKEVNEDKEKINQNNEEDTGDTQEKQMQDISLVETKGNETIYELKNADTFKVKVSSIGETWVNILNGKGYSFFQGMLTKDGTESHTVDLSKETEAVIVVGKSPDTEIYVNDQKIEFAVSPTDYVRQDITIRYFRTSE